MIPALLSVLLLPLGSGDSGAGPAVSPLRPVNTYSIVARDPETGQFGVAVQSHWFSVGTVVAWAEAGVGAVATQSLVEVSYGPLALDMLRAGKTASQALVALTAADTAPEVRQVAIVDAQGNVATRTGTGCIPEAGHHTGAGYSVQANLMEQNTVWDAMATAYESAQGDLAERMLVALEAAQKEKGDIRGQQSACILVVAGESSGRPWEDRIVDLRVEDNPEPLRELRRLLDLQRAYRHMNAGDLAIEKGDMAGARRDYGAAEALAPGNLEMTYWHAVALANAGEVEASLPLFRTVFRADPHWAVLTPRLAAVHILTASPQDLDRILQGAEAR